MSPEKAAYNRAYYLAHRDTALARAKEWYESNLERVKARRATFRAQNLDLIHARDRDKYQRRRVTILEQQRLRRLSGEERAKEHGLTLDQYRSLLDAHGGLCGICDQPMARICIDHDHLTGRVRGLLCHNCNVALGHLRDSPELLRAAADYIERTDQEAVA